jgi:hypothetical protein
MDGIREAGGEFLPKFRITDTPIPVFYSLQKAAQIVSFISA